MCLVLMRARVSLFSLSVCVFVRIACLVFALWCVYVYCVCALSCVCMYACVSCVLDAYRVCCTVVYDVVRISFSIECVSYTFRVLMLTGDALPIAKEIASRVGLGTNIISLAQVKREHAAKGEPEQLTDKDIPSNVNGFAEIFPEDKHFIIQTLQSE